MPGTTRIIGAEVSPYSIKVRSAYRYKNVPHEWVLRGTANEEFEKHAKLPLIPLVITPEGEARQDSTPILEKLETEAPEPSLHPDDPTLAFLSALIEEFGDEWGNKWMFHYRWAREADQQSAAGRLLDAMAPGLSDEQRSGMAKGLIERMTGRVWFVGSSEKTAQQIEDSYCEAVELLQAHLAQRPYLFGARPAFADFGLWGQIYNCWTDPTPGAILTERAPAAVAWVQRMLEPSVEGDFESWESLAPTLRPLLAGPVAQLFLPWSDANARAIAEGSESFGVELAGRAWAQKPQKYHARSLAALRQRYAAAASPALDATLGETGCLAWLRA